MVVVLLFRIAGTILLFVAFARRSKAIAWIGVGCILGTMALMPSLLALAAGIFGLVGASRMPELQTGLPVPDEAAQKANSFLENVHSMKMPCRAKQKLE